VELLRLGMLDPYMPYKRPRQVYRQALLSHEFPKFVDSCGLDFREIRQGGSSNVLYGEPHLRRVVISVQIR
jgi:hypothetical protein